MVMVVFTSCKKDEVDQQIEQIEEVDPTVLQSNPLVYSLQQSNSATGTLDLGCFAVDLPFDFLMADGSSVTVNVEEDFETIFFDSLNAPVDFVYPLSVTYTDGETGVLSSNEELGEAFASCVPSTGWGGNDGFPAYLICDINSCYQLEYPIDLNDGNGNVLTVNDEDAFIDAIAQNPELYFEFPFNMTDEYGNTVEVGDEDQLFELLFSCDNIVGPGDTTIVDPTDLNFFLCLEIVFPFDIQTEEGNVITVADEDGLFNAFLNGQFYEFVYPIDFLDGLGNTVTMDSEEDLFQAMAACDGFDFPLVAINLYAGVDGLCYSVNYPVTAANLDDPISTMVLENNDDLMMASFDSIQTYIIETPFTITVTASNEIVEINSIFDLEPILADCQ